MKSIKNIRLPFYDYSSNGYYFITINSNFREKILLRNKLPIEKAFDVFSGENVHLDFYVIMPDHVHLIVALNNSQIKIGEVIRRFKARASKEAGMKLWQPNYYEHVIRTEKALSKIREYIQNNPEALELKIEEFYNSAR